MTAPDPRPTGRAPLVRSAGTGAAMGVVELVPGFSGSTVALATGLYERVIANVRQGARVVSRLLKGRPGEAWTALLAIEWLFVVALLGTMVVTALVVANALGALLTDHPAEMSAVFLGLVLAAAILAARQLERPRPRHAVGIVAAAAVTFVVLGFRPGGIEDPSLFLLGVGAAFAACAWLLPGVSGAFLLLVIGLYEPFVGAVGNRDLAALATIALGVVTGMAAFGTALDWLLRNHRDAVLAVSVGLMLGSVRVLWPWPSDAGVGGSSVVALPETGQALRPMLLGVTAFLVACAFGAVDVALRRRAARETQPA